MDEEPAGLTSEPLGTPLETDESPPRDTDTNLTTKLRIRRIVSFAAFIVGLGVVAYTLNAYAACPGGECTVSYYGAAWYLFAVYTLLFSLAGFVTTSKSYLNTQKRSIVGIVFGGLVSSALILFLIFMANESVDLLTGNESFSFMISLTLPWVLIASPLLLVWVYTLLKALRVKHRLLLAFAILFVIPIVLTTYVVAMFFTSPKFTTDTKNDQQFSKIQDRASYTDKYKMMKDFITALNESDIEKASSFYYPGQKGSEVIPDAQNLIDTKDGKIYPNHVYKYTYAGYSSQVCRIDDNENLYYFNVRLYTSESNSHYRATVDLINEAKTNLWFIISRFYTTHADIKTTECQD